MRITGLKACQVGQVGNLRPIGNRPPRVVVTRCRVSLLLLCVAGVALAQTEDTPWLPVIAKLASALSQNDGTAAMEAFDSHMKDYGTIESNIDALVAQTDVLCAIDVIQDNATPAADVRTLDVDWYMTLKSQADAGPTERRRERVEVQIKKIRGKWKITALAPLSILDPIHIN